MITMGSLFSGIGGFEVAASWYGIKCIWQSEIEPWAVELLKTRFPDAKQLGDICSVNGAEIPPVDIITFGSPCFPKDTLVLTEYGFIEIQNLKIGMRVLTHKGRWRRITDIGCKYSKTIKLKGNHYNLECTPNHPIYSANIEQSYVKISNNKKKKFQRISKNKTWTEAKNMINKLWAVPNSFESLSIPYPSNETNQKGNDFPLINEDLAYFIGRWLGDGWVRNGQRSDRPIGQYSGDIILCDSKDKVEELKNTIQPITNHYNIEECKTVVKIKFTNKKLCDWLVKNFGKKAIGKQIPSWVLSQNEEFRKSILQGLIDSDGYSPKSNIYRITTISKKLAHGICLLAETLGYSTSIFKHSPNSQKIIEGRLVNQHDYYTVQIIMSEKRLKLYDDLHSWYRVKKIIHCNEDKLVWNITVDEDNSYIADSIVVHNCQDMSVAGARKGMKHVCPECGAEFDIQDDIDVCPVCGAEIEKTRSGLFMEAIRIIREMRRATNGVYPTFAVWENVPGAFTSNKGMDFRAVLEEITETKIPMPASGRWANAGVVRGGIADVAWRVMDAQYWGVPQRRKRIYLVADYRGQRAGEILFKPEGMSRHPAPCGEAWERVAADIEGSFGEASGRL